MNLEELLRDQLNWVHFRYDSTLSPLEIFSELNCQTYIYCTETAANGHPKDHTHVVMGTTEKYDSKKLNRLIVKLHKDKPDINKSTSGIRTSQIRAIAYIVKQPEIMKFMGFPPETIKILKKQSYEKLKKEQLTAKLFENEHKYYSRRITFTTFSINYWKILDSSLIDKPDFTYKAYLRKHYLHLNKKAGIQRASQLADQVEKEILDYE